MLNLGLPFLLSVLRWHGSLRPGWARTWTRNDVQIAVISWSLAVHLLHVCIFRSDTFLRKPDVG